MKPLATCSPGWLRSLLDPRFTCSLRLRGWVNCSISTSWLNTTTFLPLLVPSTLLVLSAVFHLILHGKLIKDIQGDIVDEASIVYFSVTLYQLLP